MEPPSRLSKLPAGWRGDRSNDDRLSLRLDLEVGERISSGGMSAISDKVSWMTLVGRTDNTPVVDLFLLASTV